MKEMNQLILYVKNFMKSVREKAKERIEKNWRSLENAELITTEDRAWDEQTQKFEPITNQDLKIVGKTANLYHLIIREHLKKKELQISDGKNIYVCLGSPNHLSDLKNLRNQESVIWTINRNAKIGDKVIFYLTRPISAIVGFGRVCESPWVNAESDWKEKHFAEINQITILKDSQFITNREIKLLFPEWIYIKQPRQSVLMPETIRKPFEELINERN